MNIKTPTTRIVKLIVNGLIKIATIAGIATTMILCITSNNVALSEGAVTTIVIGGITTLGLTLGYSFKNSGKEEPEIPKLPKKEE